MRKVRTHYERAFKSEFIYGSKLKTNEEMSLNIF